MFPLSYRNTMGIVLSVPRGMQDTRQRGIIRLVSPPRLDFSEAHVTLGVSVQYVVIACFLYIVTSTASPSDYTLIETEARVTLSRLP